MNIRVIIILCCAELEDSSLGTVCYSLEASGTAAAAQIQSELEIENSAGLHYRSRQEQEDDGCH